MAYVAIANGIQYSSGIAYADFFITAQNVWKSAIPSLAAGSLMLLVFTFWSRWDGIWRDPAPMRMSKVMWIAPIL